MVVIRWLGRVGLGLKESAIADPTLAHSKIIFPAGLLRVTGQLQGPVVLIHIPAIHLNREKGDQAQKG